MEVSGDPTAKELRRRSPLLWRFVAFALLFDFSMPPLMEWLDFLSFEKEIQMDAN